MLASAFPCRLPPPAGTGGSSVARRVALTPSSANQQTAAPTVVPWMSSLFGIPLLKNWDETLKKPHKLQV